MLLILPYKMYFERTENKKESRKKRKRVEDELKEKKRKKKNERNKNRKGGERRRNGNVSHGVFFFNHHCSPGNGFLPQTTKMGKYA